VEDAAELYAIPQWGKGYVETTPKGTIAIRPDQRAARSVDLYELVRGLDERGFSTPVVIRFSDTIKHRMGELRTAFDAAIAEQGYTGTFTCVYPIKVNQQRHVCEEIRDEGARIGFGLEAGSKPELLAVLALTTEHRDMPIVCNGFKDDEFIETVILATKLGRNIMPVVERFHDLELIIKHAEKYGVRPRIGIRVKPTTKAGGRWQESSGARSKFGLFVSDLIPALELLKSHGMADCLKMLHFHVGSQISDIRQFKNAVSELANIYTELARMGAGLDSVDIGGGLGIDYDGTQSTGEYSVNYTLREYADDVVYRIKAACDSAKVAHPRILSESGRAMTAYSSILVFDVLGTSRFHKDPELSRIRENLKKEDEEPQPILDLIDAYERSESATLNAREVYHDASAAREEANTLFRLGYLSLPMLSAAERLFWAIGRRILSRVESREELHEDLHDLPEALSDIYYCNFSLFQSLPDSWAIDQIFPICPIHRLEERPTRLGVLADITCDSDGKVDSFISSDGPKHTLELHEPKPGEVYYLAVFLVGAYQEVLGDLHNLFGDTHVVHVGLDDDGQWFIEDLIEGDTVREVLSYVQFDHADLRRAMRMDTERATRDGRLSVAESRALLQFYEHGLDGYTYLE
jgi:arginine decarboxylase